MNRISLPDGTRVSRLCYGAGALGTTLSGSDAERQIGAFLDAGGDFFDTAHCYACWVPGGVGASERELGRALRALGAAGRAIVATKGGHPAFGDTYPRPDDFLAADVLERDVDESCERLGVEALDLWYLHRDDGTTPIPALVERLAALVASGRVRRLGASNWSVARIDAFNACAARQGLPGFVASQIQGSLADPTWRPTADPTTRALDPATRDAHARSGIPLVHYSATASGWFAGRDGAGYDTPDNRARRERTRTLAARRGVTPTQVALAWLWASDAPTVALFGTTRDDHLAEILAADALTLTPDEARWLADGR